VNNSVAANQKTTKTVFFRIFVNRIFVLSVILLLFRASIQHKSTYSITERRVPELILVLGSQPAGDVSHKPGRKLPLISASPAVTLATLKRAVANFAAW